MAALTFSRNTIERAGQFLEAIPLAASVKIFVGALVAVNASGNALPAADTAGLKVLGRCEGMPGPGITGLDADNSSGNAGDISVNIKRGVFKFDNSTGNAVTAAQVGKVCYVEDDHTINKDGGTNKVKAGRVIGLDDAGTSVWVETVPAGSQYALTSVQNATTTATDLATSEALANALKANYNALQADVAAILALIT